MPSTATRDKLVEGAATVALGERAAKGEKPILLISPGWGSSGYYSAEMLQRDGAVAFPAGTHMFWDHPSWSESEDRPERSLRDLAAVTGEAATWRDDGPDGPGLYARSKVFAPYQDAVDEMAPHIGVSIRSMGVATEGEAEGRQGPIIEQLVADPFNTVDFVTIAGRGGKVASAFESYREASVTDRKKASEAGQDGQPTKLVETRKEVSVGDTDALVEARTELSEAQRQLATVTQERDTLKTENGRLKLGLAIRDAHQVALESITDEDIPDVARERIATAVAANPDLKEDGTLDRDAVAEAAKKAAKEEADYLAQVIGTGRVRGMGEGGAPSQDGPSLAESFQAMGMSKELAESAAKGRSV